MAKPFIFGYHRRQFRLSRTHVTINDLGVAMLERKLGRASREGFSSSARRRRAKRTSVREFDGNDAIGGKTRDRAISHESL